MAFGIENPFAANPVHVMRSPSPTRSIIVSISNSSEELHTNNASSCFMRGLRAAGRWIRSVLCCCCRRESSQEYAVDIELGDIPPPPDEPAPILLLPVDSSEEIMAHAPAYPRQLGADLLARADELNTLLADTLMGIEELKSVIRDLRQKFEELLTELSKIRGNPYRVNRINELEMLVEAFRENILSSSRELYELIRTREKTQVELDNFKAENNVR